MEISWLRVLLSNISSFLHMSSTKYINSDPVRTYYTKAEEILKLLKPVLEALVDSEIGSSEVLNEVSEELAQYVNGLRELLESWQPLSSKVYYVLQIESLISKIRGSGVDIFQLLESSKELLPDELSSSSLEHCLEKIKHMGSEQISSIIEEALKDQRDDVGLTSEILVTIAENLGLNSNQEILIEAVLLENVKENAELAEKNSEVEYLNRLISLITLMHDHLVQTKQSHTCNPVPIPPDFCCPLSLELMTDPVILASGQTYERVFIKKWMDMGLIVCPKTRQILSNTTLTPNYTVKAFIANWCELNNVKPPDPVKLISSDQPFPLLVQKDSGDSRDTNNFLPSSRSNQPMLADSIRSNSSFNAIQTEGASPLHHCSSSEDSQSGIIRNGHGLNFMKTPLDNSEDESNSEDKNTISPARTDSSNANEPEESLPEDHNRSASASSIMARGNANDNLEPNVAADRATPQGESSGLLPQLGHSRSRSQMIWARPSERLVPRIISSATTESRIDLSGIETQVKKLVEDLKSPSVDIQREAAAELRLLARNSTDNRIVIANCGAINYLIKLLYSTDTNTQEHAVTALLNLSINNNNKSLIADAGSIDPLIHVLKTGSPEAKENSAATLFSLSVSDENKIMIGRSGAIGPLVDLLGNGTPRGKRDAATALFNLSIHHENKGRIVQAGAVRHLVELMDPSTGMVDKAVVVVANLATIQEGRDAIGQGGGIPVLVEVVELGSARGKESAAAALLQLCTTSSRFCNMVRQEGAFPPLVALTQSGTARAREKAQALLTYFRNQRHGNAGRS